MIARRAASNDPAIFITPTPDEDLRAAARALMARAPEPNSLPLWGIPFAVKDNIDVAGLPTTAACPAFAYRSGERTQLSSHVCKAAGAIVIGKTNLDQFATGLNGTRSPYGAPRSVFDAGLYFGRIELRIGGRGRIRPCDLRARHGYGGIGPRAGRLQQSCRHQADAGPAAEYRRRSSLQSVDCITIFAATVGDGVAIRKVAEGFDAADAFSRHAEPAIPCRVPGLRIGVLDGAEREFFGDTGCRGALRSGDRASEGARRNHRALRLRALPRSCSPALRRAVGRRTPGGGRRLSWRRTRRISTRRCERSSKAPKARRPSTPSMADTSSKNCAGRPRPNGQKADILLLPTAPTTYTVADMLADPIVLNGRLGRYTNFVNLLDCAAIAVPAGFDSESELPGGVTLIAPAFTDDALAPLADALHRAAASGMGSRRDRHRSLKQSRACPR